MLAVAGVVSCEKEPEVKPTPPEPTPPEDTYNWITEAELMGTWERWEDDANDENIKWKYVLGLYKPREKKGWMYFCRERYCNGEYINYTMKGSSEFKIIDGKLCDVSNKDKVYEYEICFPWRKFSERFICQKSLLKKGSLRMLEELFEGKMIKK